jgi:D-alanyl-D-alanine carboxypeptidase
MAIIGRALMQEPKLARIVAQRRHEVQGPPRWVFHTRNPLLGVYDGVDGIKTGYDDLAGRCLVATATREGRRAIAVVLNSPRYDVDAAALLDYAFGDRRWGASAPVATAAQSGQNRVAMVRADLSAPATGAPTSVMGALRAATSIGERGQT